MPLPSGVTLQAIDGETLTSSTTMSNNYFASNGYTAATNTSYSTSWDDPAFFPNALIFGVSTAQMSNFLAEGFKVTIGASSGDPGNIAAITSNSVWYPAGNFGPRAGVMTGSTSGFNLTITNINTAFIQVGEMLYGTDGTNSLPQGTTIVSQTSGTTGQAGVYVISNAASPGNIAAGSRIYYVGGFFENVRGSYNPALWSDESNILGFVGAMPDAELYSAGRFINWVQTDSAICGFGTTGGISPTTMNGLLAANALTTPGGHSMSVGTFSCDFYFFATQADTVHWKQSASNLIYQSGQPAFTQAQMARGSNYGNLIDIYRFWSTNSAAYSGGQSIPTTALPAARLPFFAIPENKDGLVSSTPITTIQPYEMNWAVWSSIIHGARGITYFVYANGFTGMGTPPSGSPPTVTGTYGQVILTNALTNALAKILNSPFALNYASVSPNGYTFPVPMVNSTANWCNGGVELMTKWFQGGSYTNSYNTTWGGGPSNLTDGFYIFATTRESETTTNLSATFTINDPSATSVNVIGENRSISISGGQFTDSFANAYTVHIYQMVTTAAASMIHLRYRKA